jgi:hypothetical protein
MNDVSYTSSIAGLDGMGAQGVPACARSRKKTPNRQQPSQCRVVRYNIKLSIVLNGKLPTRSKGCASGSNPSCDNMSAHWAT